MSEISVLSLKSRFKQKWFQSKKYPKYSVPSGISSKYSNIVQAQSIGKKPAKYQNK